MNIGQISIIIAFISALGATYFYVQEGRNKSLTSVTAGLPGKSFGYRLFIISALFGGIAAITMLVLLLTHQYQYSYVAHYSSDSLPAIYLVSAFWAGQEGTFLLWSLYVCVMGLVFSGFGKRRDAIAMAVVSAFAGFLFLLMIAKSPFEISQTIPHDGEGMNPLLQDLWMAIHPPILFMGYAATVFPFALVISALWKKDFGHWFSSGFSWTLFAALTLGAGIIIGGFWAYEVLGWGGYWGWDPVENSSLVPWLTLLALVHGFVIQRARGSLVRTNALIAILVFLFVLYATFLTRSGVLADFSVHSFVDLGINGYLIGVLAVSTVLGIGVFVWRFRSVTSAKMDFSHLNREMTLAISMAVLLLGVLFTFFGMSSPLLTGMFGKASQVDTSFYNKVNLPVAIGIALLLGITPFLGWKEEAKQGMIRRYSMSLALTVLSCVIAYVAGVTSWWMMLFVGTAAFGLISNVIITFRQYRTGWLMLGGPIAHIGVGLLFLGILGSGSFDDTTRLLLIPGQPQNAFGYQFTFRGIPDLHAEKPKIDIEVSDGKQSYIASPSLYFSNYNQSLMRQPDIKIFPMKDLYISPMEVHVPDPAESGNLRTLDLTKGETKEFAGYKVTFERFETGQHDQGGMMSVGAVLKVTVGDKEFEVIPQFSITSRGERQTTPVPLPAQSSTSSLHGPQIALDAINVDEQQVHLEFFGLAPKENPQPAQTLLVEVSTKPLMMVLWTGVVLIIAGSVIAWRRRVVSAE